MHVEATTEAELGASVSRNSQAALLILYETGEVIKHD